MLAARALLPAPHEPISGGGPYKCAVCGAEVPDLPTPVLKHQMSHVERRPLARDRPKLRPDREGDRPPRAPADD